MDVSTGGINKTQRKIEPFPVVRIDGLKLVSNILIGIVRLIRISRNVVQGHVVGITNPARVVACFFLEQHIDTPNGSRAGIKGFAGQQPPANLRGKPQGIFRYAGQIFGVGFHIEQIARRFVADPSNNMYCRANRQVIVIGQ